MFGSCIMKGGEQLELPMIFEPVKPTINDLKRIYEETKGNENENKN